MANIVKTIIAFRRGTTAEWEANKSVVPVAGEPCFDLELHTLKIGDGTTTYENLPAIGGVKAELSADGKSLVLEDGVFKLVGFAGAEVGAQPRKNAEGNIEWVVPSTKDVDDLKSSVSGLKSDVTNLQSTVTVIKEIVTPSGEGATPILSRVESLEHKMDGTGAGTVDAKIDAKINEFAANLTDDGIVNTIQELFKYVSDHGADVTKMVGDIEQLKGLVGGKSVEDQIAESGHLTKAEAEETLLSKVEAGDFFRHIKYEISNKPVGTLVDYGEKEIRVMVPADTQYTHQNPGATGDSNMYYIGFKAYAPEGAVSFKEDTAEIISDDTMYYFEGNDFAGIDKYGRKYSICWLAVAQYNPTTEKWAYYGEKSSKERYIGWHYSVEWYDADGVKIDSDCIRISLSNESCHNIAEPYYMGKVVKEIAIGDTVLTTVNNRINLPVGAGLKGSDEISIAEDGTVSINAITWDKISQGESELILDGGGAAANK